MTGRIKSLRSFRIFKSLLGRQTLPNRVATLCGIVVVLVAACLASPADAQIVSDKVEKLYAKVVSANVVVTNGVDQNIQGQGSGVIVHKDGYIVTAAHVVDSNNTIGIEYHHGEKTTARIVSFSRTHDVALLKTKDPLPDDLYIAKFGDSDKVKPGQQLFCIGAPRGLRFSVSVGYVSAVRRNVGSRFRNFEPVDVIQADAAVNPGNSGGALFNMDGEVIGIASAIISDKVKNFAGVSLAVPSNLVRRKLFDDAFPYLGLHIQRIHPAWAEALNWPPLECFLIEQVRTGSAAEKAGLRGGKYNARIDDLSLFLGGDLIYEIDGVAVGDLEKTHKHLHEMKDGQTVVITIWRAGKLEKINYELKDILPIPSLPYPAPETSATDHRD